MATEDCRDEGTGADPSGGAPAGHPHDHPHDHPRGGGDVSRRLLLGAAVGGALAAGLPSRPVLAGATGSDVHLDVPPGLVPVSNAMHLHGSFSEGMASWTAHLSEAQRCGVQVVWPTEHDDRMEALPGRFRRVVDMQSISETVNGFTWTWAQQGSGTPVSTGGGIVPAPTDEPDTMPTPGDPPPPPLALRTMVAAAGSAATFGYWADTTPRTGYEERGNISGRTLTLDVHAAELSGETSFLEVVLELAYFPAATGRPAGRLVLHYRFARSEAAPRTVGREGYLQRELPVGRFVTVTLTPEDDVALLWPDVAARDNTIYALYLRAGSTDGVADGYFRTLRLDRALTGDALLKVQRGVLEELALSYPDVRVMEGLEYSRGAHHINGFGTGLTMLPPKPPTTDVLSWSAACVHAVGGLASMNHPFGVTDPSNGVDAATVQVERRRAVARELLNARVYGVDLIEVGYQIRGRVTLSTHLQLWDVLSRNGFWLTGTGVSDNHSALVNTWDLLGSNCFVTSVWVSGAAAAGELTEPDLLAGMAAGRAFVWLLSSFRGQLWISLDDAPMGSVSIRPQMRSRTLWVSASGVPDGGVVQVLAGKVDYAGTSQPDPATAILATLPAARFAAGPVAVPVVTTYNRFFRVQVRDAAGKLIAFSNPVWHLVRAGQRAIPPARREAV